MRLRQALFACGLGVPLLVLGACAGEPDGRADANLALDTAHPDAGPDGAVDRRPRSAKPLFISPAGEPFHGAPDGPPPVSLWFAQADADRDGRLTRAELTADYDRFFRRLDANGDGVIDGFEMQAYERLIAPELLPQVGRLRAGEGQDQNLFKGGRGGRGGGRGGHGGGASSFRSGPGAAPGGQTAGAFQLFPDLEPIAAADSNLDGKVTLVEWRARAAAVFRQLDPAEAGALILAALPKTPQQAAIEKRKVALERRGRT